MKSYFTFQPIPLLGPAIRQISGLIILVFALVYFLSMNQLVIQKGFDLPDSLVDTVLKFSPTEQIPANPQLLKQLGLDPKILDSLGSSDKVIKNASDTSNNLVKKTLKDQFQTFIKPYLTYIPFILALLLFLTFQSLTSIINLLIYPLLLIVFYILEKSHFIKFTTEMREVKKMII